MPAVYSRWSGGPIPRPRLTPLAVPPFSPFARPPLPPGSHYLRVGSGRLQLSCAKLARQDAAPPGFFAQLSCAKLAHQDAAPRRVPIIFA